MCYGNYVRPRFQSSYKTSTRKATEIHEPASHFNSGDDNFLYPLAGGDNKKSLITLSH